MPDVCVMLFDPRQDNERAYKDRSCTKLLLHLHIDTVAARVDNGAHMTISILNNLQPCNNAEGDDSSCALGRKETQCLSALF